MGYQSSRMQKTGTHGRANFTGKRISASSRLIVDKRPTAGGFQGSAARKPTETGHFPLSPKMKMDQRFK